MDTSTEPQPTPPVPKRRFAERGIGIVMVIASGVLGYLAVILPLIAASRHEDDVSISMKGVVFVPALLIIGIMLISVGDRAGQIFGSRQKPSLVGWIVCIVTAVIGILLYEWLKSRMRAYGYGF